MLFKQYQKKLKITGNDDLTILASIILLFFTLFFINNDWIYNFIGWPDGWAYFGYSYNPIMMRKVFPSHPLGDLLPLVLPAGFFYWIFEVFWANFFYKMLSFTLCGWIMYKILKMEFDYQTAILGTISLLLYKNFLSAIGCDYTGGRVILYYLASIFFILKAVQSTRQAMYLFLSGLFFSLSVSTALLSIIYAPVLLFMFWGKKFQISCNLKTLFSWSLFYAPTGFLSGILFLCLVHYLYTGKFIYFENTIIKAMSFLETGRGAPPLNFSLHWLAIPLFSLLQVVIYSVYLYIKNKSLKQILRERWLIFLGASAISILIMSLIQVFENQNTIQDFHYFNQTIPITFIAMSGVFYSTFAAGMDKKFFKVLIIFFIIAGILQFGYITSFKFKHTFFINQFSTITALFWAACVALALYIKNKNFYIVLFVFAFFMLNFNPYSYQRLSKSLNTTESVPNRKTMMYLSTDWIKYMNKIDPEREAYLWYDGRWYTNNNSKAYRVSLAASSHLWQGHIYNESFPDCNIAMGELGIIKPEILTHQPLIIMADDKKTLEVASQNLKNEGINLTCDSGTDFISSGKNYFDIYVCKCNKIDKIGSK